MHVFKTVISDMKIWFVFAVYLSLIINECKFYRKFNRCKFSNYAWRHEHVKNEVKETDEKIKLIKENKIK